MLQCNLQLLIQPLICVPGTQYDRVAYGSLKYKVYWETSTII